MWLVALALRRPYTFVVLAIIAVLLAGTTIRRMGTDLLPEIDIPIVAVVFNYNGMSPDDMEKRVISGFERLATTTVNDIDHLDSQSLSGMGIIRIYFHPGAKVDLAIAQVTSITESAIRSMPPGMTPPIMMKYNAANVPVLLTSLGSDTLNEQQIFDIANNFIRTGLATVQGAQVPNPYGGRQRGVVVDLDPVRMQAYGMSAADITAVLDNQNLVLPAGSVKIGNREYPVRLNSNPSKVADFNDLPLKEIGGTTVFLRDVANVRDGFFPQTSLVRVDGRRGVLQQIRKTGGASTVEIVERTRATIAKVMTTVPAEVKLDLLSDQSVFVIGAIHGVLLEGLTAAGLTGLLIMAFLGSLGYTLNLMTLGGLALAIGILVDDATVEVENIHRNLNSAANGQRKSLNRAILDGASQIAVPTLVSTLCICIVFIPVLFITGPARSLFVPMSVAVVAAMLTSYFLSRTLVPTLVSKLLRREIPGAGAHRPAWNRPVERAFALLQRIYAAALASVLRNRALTVLLFAAFIISGAALLPRTGRDLFPTVDAGQIRLHVRCPPATRIEETERRFAQVEHAIRDEIPADELERVISIIGMPSSPINLILGDPSMISSADGEVQIFLAPGHHPTGDYLKRLRDRLSRDFPEEFFFSQRPTSRHRSPASACPRRSTSRSPVRPATRRPTRRSPTASSRDSAPSPARLTCACNRCPRPRNSKSRSTAPGRWKRAWTSTMSPTASWSRSAHRRRPRPDSGSMPHAASNTTSRSSSRSARSRRCRICSTCRWRVMATCAAWAISLPLAAAAHRSISPITTSRAPSTSWPAPAALISAAWSTAPAASSPGSATNCRAAPTSSFAARRRAWTIPSRACPPAWSSRSC